MVLEALGIAEAVQEYHKGKYRRSMEQRIQEEFQSVKNSAQPTIEDYLNNFYLHFPNESLCTLEAREFHLRAMGRAMTGSRRDIYTKESWERPKPPRPDGQPVMQGRAPKQFYEAIDYSFSRAGLREKKLHKLQRSPSQLLNKYLFPAYVLMRTEGYAHKDLAG